jgi:hypothetical protein
VSLYFYIYHSLLLAAIVLSLIAYFRGAKNFGWLAAVLSVTLLIELVVELMTKRQIPFGWIYHLFNIIEYCLFVVFLLSFVKNKIVYKSFGYSIPVYIMLALSISHFFYRFAGFPGININIEGFLLFVLCTYILFNLDVSGKETLWQLPVFWICTGVLIFFGCTFFYNGIYSNVINLDKATALRLFGVLNKPLNIALYGFILIGLLCLILKKKPIFR